MTFDVSGKYQNKEKPLKRQRKLGLDSLGREIVALYIDQREERTFIIICRQTKSVSQLTPYDLLQLTPNKDFEIKISHSENFVCMIGYNNRCNSLPMCWDNYKCNCRLMYFVFD